jgi:hypothetical protein
MDVSMPFIIPSPECACYVYTVSAVCSHASREQDTVCMKHNVSAVYRAYHVMYH